MKSLITPLEVVRRAFGSGECIAPDAVTEADIIAAEERYLRPILGDALHDRLLEGAYEEFRQDYLATCTALFVRVFIQPRLDTRTSTLGTLSPKSDNGTAADPATRRYLRHNLRTEANTLLRRAVRYLEAHRTEYPEYDAHENLFYRCSIDGGFL